MGDQNDDEVENELPENLEALLVSIGFFIPETDDEELLEVIRRGAEGLCCTCEGPLQKNTLIVIGVDGVRMAFCCGACLTDMHVVGWLQTQHADIVEQVNFRGGKVDPDGLSS